MYEMKLKPVLFAPLADIDRLALIQSQLVDENRITRLRFVPSDHQENFDNCHIVVSLVFN
jgi:hypothetical protein